MEAADARAELLRLLRDHLFAPRDFPLDRAALLLAVAEYPHLDCALYEERLQGYADRITEHLGGLAPEPGEGRQRLAVLRRIVYEEAGFRGNRDDYYNPQNSYLNEVLDRKLGIPVSLALVVLGIARRLDWPVWPVNFPNHFLVSYIDGDELLALDAFDGLILGEEELRERWLLSTGSDPPDVAAMLAPTGPSQVLLRSLNNLRMLYSRARDSDRYHSVLAMMTLIASEVQPLE